MVFDPSIRPHLTMVWTPAANVSKSTCRDDLWLQSYQNHLEATPGPTEEAIIRQQVRVPGNGKHQTEQNTNTCHGLKWMGVTDVILYAGQHPAGDISKVKMNG
jgi:hypothetical protein